MAIKFERVKAGDVLYDKHRYQMGNTTMRAWGVWTVEVVSIDHEKGTARVRWNGNPETTYYRRGIEKLYRKRPEIRSRF